MSRKSKPFNIGDTFFSWVVVECINPKKYRFLCRCSCCGAEKEFYKYNLLRGTFAPCKTCGHLSVKHTALLRKHWNSDLNGTIFTKPQHFSLTQSYWFVCDNGHNFKSTIKDFSLDKCLGCKTRLKDDSLRTNYLDYAYKLFTCIYDDVKVEDIYSLVIEDERVVLMFVESDRFKSHRLYYGSESEFVNDLTKYKFSKKKWLSEGYRAIEVPLRDNLLENVDTIERIVLELT